MFNQAEEPTPKVQLCPQAGSQLQIADKQLDWDFIYAYGLELK